jgi:hypothetical protein
LCNQPNRQRRKERDKYYGANIVHLCHTTFDAVRWRSIQAWLEFLRGSPLGAALHFASHICYSPATTKVAL